MKSVSDKIQDFLEKELLVGSIGKDTALVDDGYIDSIQILELSTFIEDSFGVTLDADDMQIENFETINAIAIFVAQKRA